VGWARGKQTDFIYGHELWIKQFNEKKEWFKEEDINFDGFPDLILSRIYRFWRPGGRCLRCFRMET
jgi:hypothetical protein